MLIKRGPLASLWNHRNIDGLVQDSSNSIANALELLQSCTKPSIYRYMDKKNTSKTTTTTWILWVLILAGLRRDYKAYLHPNFQSIGTLNQPGQFMVLMILSQYQHLVVFCKLYRIVAVYILSVVIRFAANSFSPHVPLYIAGYCL